jgi:hypothetical protein
MEPWRCSLCDLQTDAIRYPQTPLTDNMPKIQLRCGHEYHTHCYMYKIMNTEDLPVHDRCPDIDCGEYLLPDNVREFYRDDTEVRRADTNVVTLWNENEVFRNELKEIMKLRKKFKSEIAGFRPLYRTIHTEFKEKILAYRESIKYEKREFRQRLMNLSERRRAVFAMSRYKRKLNDFVRKYQIWTTNLRALHGIRGAPRIPLRSNFGITWAERRLLRSYIRVST